MDYICTDATYDPETGHAGIAACLPGGKALAAAVVRADTINEAEALALDLAMQKAKIRRIRRAEFRCDNEGVVNMILARDSRLRTGGLGTAIARARQQLHDLNLRDQRDSKPWYWKVEHVDRRNVQPAHKLAELIYRAWQAGRESIHDDLIP